MARRTPLEVISHWNHLIESFSTSPQEYYASVEAAISHREIPDVTTSRIDWKEGGLLTARREYLRVSRGRLSFDICAAPFGTGFFFSWWLTEMTPKWGPFLGCGGVLAILFATLVSVGAFGWRGLLFAMFAIPLAVVVGALAVHNSSPQWEDELLGIPLVGRVYGFFFRPLTYYKLDTTLMYQSAVHAAVLEAIDGLVEAHGLRALSEGERKPVLKGIGLP